MSKIDEIQDGRHGRKNQYFSEKTEILTFFDKLKNILEFKENR